MFNLTENRSYLFTGIFSLYLMSALCCSVNINAEESWYPSKYGATDRLGAINNLSSSMVKKAAALIESGAVYSLAMNTGPDTPAFGHRNYQLLTKPIDGAGKVYEFFFMLAAPKFVGALQTVVHPVAIR